MTTKTNTTEITQHLPLLQTREDLKTALLIVSMTVNIFLFTAWLVIQADPNLSLVLLQTS